MKNEKTLKKQKNQQNFFKKLFLYWKWHKET